MARKIEDEFKKLNDIEHCLLKPGMYIGSTNYYNDDKWILEDNKFKLKNVDYIPGFFKIFDEIITNSIDESKRNKKLNKIEVDITENEISVKDNGGIPVVKHKIHKEWIPEMVFSNLKTGSNFHDEDNRSWAGTYGVGSTVTNIFSKSFVVITADGKNKFEQVFEDNMKIKNKPTIKKSTQKFTKIKFKPDVKRFNLEKIDDIHFKILEKRVYDVAACNPKIKIYFNKELIKINSFQDYIKYYVDDFIWETQSNENWQVAVAPNGNGFNQISFVNSIETSDGGTHVNYILNQINHKLVKALTKKYKFDVKYSDVKNNIFLFINSTIINPSFSSQTKEKLITELSNYGSSFTISDKFINKIMKSEIIQSIIDLIEERKKIEDRKLKRKLNQTIKKINVEKLIDSKGKDRWKHSLAIFEGDSAKVSFRKFRDPKTQGGFSLRGKFINVNEITHKKLMKNNEAINLMASIGLKIDEKLSLKDLRYGKILLYVDADTDGNSIAAQLINFFYNFWPEMFDSNMICKIETPIVVAENKKDKDDKLFFYSQIEYDNWYKKKESKNYHIKYKKGLAALVDDEYKKIIQDPKITVIKKDDISEETLNTWFGKDSTPRKKQLLT